MNVIKTDIEGVLIIEPRLFRDARGYFFRELQRARVSRESGAIGGLQGGVLPGQ